LVGQGENRTFVLVFDTGDEVVEGLTRFAESEHLASSHFTGIGAFRDAVIGYFDWEKKDYLRIPVREQVEVLSLAGDITLDQDHPKVHAHVVLGSRDGNARGGHLLEGHVRPTLELVVVESPSHLRREMDAESGLALIRLSGSPRPQLSREGSPP
jgi:predicted DNA-binding protein with PD1-like motif